MRHRIPENIGTAQDIINICDAISPEEALHIAFWLPDDEKTRLFAGGITYDDVIAHCEAKIAARKGAMAAMPIEFLVAERDRVITEADYLQAMIEQQKQEERLLRQKIRALSCEIEKRG